MGLWILTFLKLDACCMPNSGLKVHKPIFVQSHKDNIMPLCKMIPWEKESG